MVMFARKHDKVLMAVGLLLAGTLVWMPQVAVCKQASDSDGANPKDDTYVQDNQYQRSAKGLLPLAPDQIRKFNQRLDATQKAIHSRHPASVTSQSHILRLEPGAKPQTVKVAPGYVSSVVFLDETGAPWALTSATVGDKSAFDVQRPDIKDKNLLQIAAKGRNRDSNLSITLAGYSMPVLLHLTTDADSSTSITFRADQMGPNATPQVVGPPAKKTIGRTMMSFLDGVPPSDARRLDTKGVEGRNIQAWAYNNKLYLRSHQAAVWPAWDQVAKGAGGVRVYRMPLESYVMVSENGEINTVQLSAAPSVKGANR